MARTPAQRRADALVDVCRFFLERQACPPATRHRPHVNVVLDYDDLLARGSGRLVDDGVVDATTIARLLCDANVHRVVREGRSSVLDYGTATRTVARPCGPRWCCATATAATRAAIARRGGARPTAWSR
jgi:hypothetical protein